MNRSTNILSKAKDTLLQLLKEFTLYLASGFVISLIAQFVIIAAWSAFIYVSGSHGGTLEDGTYLKNWESWYFWIAANTAIVYALALFIFRGYISPIIFMIVAVLYSAVVKYFTGSLLLGFDATDFMFVIMFAMYVTGMTFFSAMVTGRLQTAITYRTTQDDE